MFIQFIRKDWYMARAKYQGRQINVFAKTRQEAIEGLLNLINTIKWQSVL